MNMGRDGVRGPFGGSFRYFSNFRNQFIIMKLHNLYKSNEVIALTFVDVHSRCLNSINYVFLKFHKQDNFELKLRNHCEEKLLVNFCVGTLDACRYFDI